MEAQLAAVEAQAEQKRQGLEDLKAQHSGALEALLRRQSEADKWEASVGAELVSSKQELTRQVC